MVAVISLQRHCKMLSLTFSVCSLSCILIKGGNSCERHTAKTHNFFIDLCDLSVVYCYCQYFIKHIGYVADISIYGDMSVFVGMAVFLRNVAFHGILLDALFEPGNPDWQTVHELVSYGICDGTVKPLPATVFDRDDIEEAFRFMAHGKHVGKVLVKVNCIYEVCLCSLLMWLIGFINLYCLRHSLMPTHRCR